MVLVAENTEDTEQPEDQPEVGKRRMPNRGIERVELEGDWEGWWFECHMALPFEKYGELMGASVAFFPSDDDEGITNRLLSVGESVRIVSEQFRKITTRWNFVDEQGADLDITLDASWQILPTDLGVQMFLRYIGQVGSAPLASAKASPDSL